MRINLFYPFVVLVAIAVVFLFRSPQRNELNFFGFAESQATTVNYNYPLVVDRILVEPGQAIVTGQPLFEVSRVKAKETMPDEGYRIANLRAEERLWRERKRSQLSILQNDYRDRAEQLATRISAERAELARAQSVFEGLSSIEEIPAGDYAAVTEIKNLEAERLRIVTEGEERAAALERELAIGGNPYAADIARLGAKARFDSSQLVQAFTVTAPADGLVGNVGVREGEHVTSYQTLLSFYEPHSRLVSGYIHEDLTPSVALGDRMEVYSLKQEGVVYAGVVSGLGSRIVAIPTRLRKLPDLETYGREVIIEITSANDFLQKEKVGVRKLTNAASR